VKDVLDSVGFLCSGIGSLLFFFVYSVVLKTTEIMNLSEEEHIGFTPAIKSWWLKSRRRKEIALRFANQGTWIGFFLYALGFVLQLIAKQVPK
jgi:hypothetical protein